MASPPRRQRLPVLVLSQEHVDVSVDLDKLMFWAGEVDKF